MCWGKSSSTSRPSTPGLRDHVGVILSFLFITSPPKRPKPTAGIWFSIYTALLVQHSERTMLQWPFSLVYMFLIVFGQQWGSMTQQNLYQAISQSC